MLHEHTSTDEPGRSHRQLETLAVCTAVLMAAALGVQLATVLDRPGAWGAAGCALLVGYFAADGVSGLVHWAFDRVFDESTRWLGPHFVRPFREHHDDPEGITRHDFIELNGNTCIAAVPVLVATWIAFDPASSAASVFGPAFVLVFVALTVMTNQFHQWAHQPDPPRAAHLLQRCHVILPRGHHAVHHQAPFDTHYCITSGVMNRWVDRSGLLPAIESWLASWRGVSR